MSRVLKLKDNEVTHVSELVGHTRESSTESRWGHLRQMDWNLRITNISSIGGGATT